MLFLICFFTSYASIAATWYVNDASTTGDVFTTAAGSLTNSGSKSSPFLTLAQAITAAAPGDTIIIDSGTFSDKNLSITKAGLTIIGAGVTKTVFDNNSAGSDANAFAVISASNVTLKNFHVTEYNYSLGGGRGKAITVLGSTTTGVVLDGMLIQNNGSSGGNGAFMVSGGAKATIKNGADSCNLPTGSFGGGIDVDGIGSEIIVHNQYISKNARGIGNGGAINITNGAKAVVSNTVFDGNSAINGGAIYVNGTLEVTNSIFKNNIANQTSSTANGGAIAVARGSTATISNSEFISNVAGTAASTTGNGGAISINTGLGSNYTGAPAIAKLTLNNVSFTNNTATSSGRHIYGDEGSSNNAEVIINNASFSGTTGTATTDIFQRTNTEVVFSISNSGNPSKTNILAAQQLNTNAPTGFTTPTVPFSSGSCVTFSCNADSYFPVITECVPNKTLTPTNCVAVIPDYRSEVVASDDCALTITQNPAPGSTLATGVNTVTMTVTDASGNAVTCTFTVTVTGQATQSPGTNGSLTICPGTTLTTDLLFNALGGSPSTGGTWSPAIAGAGIYTYTVNNCPDLLSATVTVTQISQPNAGTNGTLTICAGNTVTESQLFSQLGNNPATGGTWSPALAGAGTYTYTVAATSPCTENATAT
ncbi:MAG: beta strand repeat-containing protein, partial [Dolichospermum sp.]